MKKWLFSKNGKTLGPLNLNDAKEFVTANPDSFAWHPSYSNWMPVSCINEFINVLPTPKPPQAIPSELINEFLGKERGLVEKLDILDGEVNTTSSALAELEQEIQSFKEVTKNCSAQVQDTLRQMEEKFASLSSGFAGLKKEVSISKQQFADTKKDFDLSLEQNNTPVVDAPLTVKRTEAQAQNQPSGSDELKKALAETEKMAQSVQEKAPTTVTPMTKVATTVKEISNSPAASSPSQAPSPNNSAPSSTASAPALQQAAPQAVVQPTAKPKVEPVIVEKPQVKPAVASSSIEFTDEVSEDDLALMGAMSVNDDDDEPEDEQPIAVNAPVRSNTASIGEFDHILYDALNSDKAKVDEDDAKRRLRRRRRR